MRSHIKPSITGWRSRAVFIVAISLVATSCTDGEPVAPGTPAVESVSATANPNSVLSSVVHFTTRNADSARVNYGITGEPRDSTPFQSMVGDTGSIVVIGLHADTPYMYLVEAVRGTKRAESAPLTSHTGALPTDLQRVALTSDGPASAGYLLTAVTLDSNGYALAFGPSGDVCWYRRFGLRPGENAVETKQQPDGTITVFIGATFGWQPTYGRYFQILPSGELVGTHAASVPYYTDNHELLLTGSAPRFGEVLLFGYDLRHVDLTSLGGQADVLLAGHSIVRQTREGSVKFFWSAWDHFTLRDWIEIPPDLAQLTNTDFDHPNSLDIDGDGNYVASFRNLSEITKIDAVTGAIIWRLGGRNNQFTLVNDPLSGFAGQHSVRVLPNGDLLLFDNGIRHAPPESRAAQYRVDAVARTATLVWQFRHDPPLFSPFLGSVQRFQDGRTLIGYGGLGVATEVSAAGAVLWEGRLLIDGAPTSFYRAIKVRSLYQFEAP